MLYRVTTSGNLKNYRYNLQSASYNLNKTLNTVLTGRNFNSYKENASAASRSFQMRSSLSQAASQKTVSDSVISKYEVAWSTLSTAVDDVNAAKSSISYAANDPTGSGRIALGQQLNSMAGSIVQYMNATYGSNHVFAGADGLNAPFVLTEDGQLTYRGVDVSDNTDVLFKTAAPINVGATGFNASETVTVEINGVSKTYTFVDGTTTTPDPANDEIALSGDIEKDLEKLSAAIAEDFEGCKTSYTYEEQAGGGYNVSLEVTTQNGKKAADLQYLATGDHKYVDLGIGLDESSLKTTTFDSSLSGLYYLGYGSDENGVSNNIVCIMDELGDILQRCDADSGDFASAEDETRFNTLYAKFEDAASIMTNRYAELDATASYLKNNHQLLDNRIYTLKEQISNLEDVDEADAISAYTWAKYCHDAALKVGGSILGNSLMDYINT